MSKSEISKVCCCVNTGILILFFREIRKSRKQPITYWEKDHMELCFILIPICLKYLQFLEFIILLSIKLA